MHRERFSTQTFMPVWIRHEHLARYEFAKGFVAGKRVIDCACGAGISSALFARSGAVSVEAFDLSEETVQAARRDHGATANLQFRVASATKLPLPDHGADVYVSLETIEHVDEAAEFLKEVHRVLAPDGTFVCSTPNRVVTNPGKLLADKPWFRFHVREYSVEEFVALLRTCFDSVQLYGQNPQWTWKVRLVGCLGRVLPMHGAVRINQFCKLPRLLLDRYEHHLVEGWRAGRLYESITAVCRRPR